MDLVLKRTDFTANGIFGELIGTGIFTLERAYPALIGQMFLPKLPPGTYTCKLGPHNLHSGPITTYEVMNVPGHTGILLHPGNTQDSSNGCILLGIARVNNSVIESRKAFAKFMELQKDTDTFTLTVI